MNKVKIFFLVMVLSIGAFTMTAFAATTPSIKVTAEPAFAGKEVSVDVTVAENPGIAAFKFKLEFDKTKITPVSAVLNPQFSDSELMSNIKGDLTALEEVTAYWVNPSSVDENGKIFTVKFKIKSGITGEIPLTLSYVEGDIANQYLENVDFTIEQGKIAVKTGYTITFKNPVGGTVSGGGTVAANMDTTVKATPNTGYEFDGWYVNNVKVANAKATYTFKVTANKVLEAKFKKVVRVNSIKLNKDKTQLFAKGTETLRVIFTPAKPDNTNVTWVSSKPSIVKVDQTGKITAVNVGSAIITATSKDGSKKASCTVTVAPTLAKTVTLNIEKANVKKGAALILKATINPKDVTNNKLTWTSNSPTIAKVDANGKVTGLKEGKATITVKTSNGKADTCVITVIK